MSKIYNYPEWTLSNFHCHPFVLEKGSFAHLHAHKEDHLVQANKEIAVYVIKDGIERIERIEKLRKDMGGVIPFETIIEAGIEHLIIALEDGITNCQCLFSRFDYNGIYLHDSKECSNELNVKTCDPYLLPKIVKDLINAKT